MVKFRENKGITLVTLAATVAVLFILLTVSLTVGTNVIEKIKLDNYYTNIHAVKTKAKVFAEEVNAQVWNLDENQKKEKRTELFSSNYGMTEQDISSQYKSQIAPEVGEQNKGYLVTGTTLEKMGLGDLQEIDNYIVVYNESDYTVLDVIYKPGVKYENRMYYTFSQLDTII